MLSGLRQGDAIFPQLFNIVLEWIVRKLETVEARLPLGGLQTLFAYVEDIYLIDETTGVISAIKDTDE